MIWNFQGNWSRWDQCGISVLATSTAQGAVDRLSSFAICDTCASSVRGVESGCYLQPLDLLFCVPHRPTSLAMCFAGSLGRGMPREKGRWLATPRGGHARGLLPPNTFGGVLISGGRKGARAPPALPLPPRTRSRGRWRTTRRRPPRLSGRRRTMVARRGSLYWWKWDKGAGRPACQRSSQCNLKRP